MEIGCVITTQIKTGDLCAEKVFKGYNVEDFHLKELL